MRTSLLSAPAAGYPLFLGGALCALFGLLAVGEAHGATRWETLEAIHNVENPHDRQAPGPKGELGPYQFRLETWRMYSHRPFSAALERDASDAVAVRHYEWLRTALERNGFEPSVYNIALAWNAGIGAVTNGRAPRVSRDYAARVENIAGELARRRQVAETH